MRLGHNHSDDPSRQIRTDSISAHSDADRAELSARSRSTLWFARTNALAIAVEFELSYLSDPLLRWLDHPEV